jgi:triacylglycerol esterase/lipase EstA (alpha/beta hydrolase family)
MVSRLLTLDEAIKEETENSVKDFPEFLKNVYLSRHFVLVDGFFNEGARLACLYFTDNIAQLKALGFTCSHLRYRSTRSLFINAEHLHRDIMKIHAKYKKPIILFGHSMGGGEALCLALNHPDFLLDNIIDKVINTSSVSS